MLHHFKSIIIDHLPELGEATFTLMTEGWDSMAVDVDDWFIFKFPRIEEAGEALRREAAMLAVVRPQLTLPVPNLAFYETPQPFSKHPKLKGDHLVTAQYERLSSNAKQQLAEDVAHFYAQLHAMDSALLQAAGALPLKPWPAPKVIAAGVQPHLPQALQQKAHQTLAQWVQLTDDPYGITYGFFDCHGWNMAFDHGTQRLVGMYDFGDAGFGALHQEFIYTSLVSADLTSRVVGTYERITGRKLERERISILTGVLLMIELAQMGNDADKASLVLQNALNWLHAN